MRAPTVSTAPFESILSPGPAGDAPAQRDDTLHDLALDQVFDRLAGQAPRAAAAFTTPLGSEAEIEYRQAVFRGLEDPGLRAAVQAFLEAMAGCDRRDAAAADAHYRYEPELWHLRAVAGYVEAIEAFDTALTDALPGAAADSEGWDRLARHLADVGASAGFAALRDEVRTLERLLAALRFNVLIRGPKVSIAPTDDEPDLGAAVTEVFSRFRHADAEDHRTAFAEPAMDHVQGWILERVAQVHPRVFDRLIRFVEHTRQYREPVLQRFSDEVRFYLAYLDHVAPMRAAGLPLCYPRVRASGKELDVRQAWDLALASRLVEHDQPVVANDLRLGGPERILVISGPNQGGKTTTARLFGQLHHLAAIGCPIPGSRARLFLCDRVFTVFEREENLDTPEGRLGAEVRRLHEVFEQATDRTVIVINEAFASTALHDARILTRDVLQRISRLDALAACVTFIDELSRLNEKTVSMVSEVDPADPTVRTFRVRRQVADGRAFAQALAAKHELTFSQIVDRLARPVGSHAAVPGVRP